MVQLVSLYTNVEDDLQTVIDVITNISGDCENTWNGDARRVFVEHMQKVQQQVAKVQSDIDRCQVVLDKTIANYSALETSNTQQVENATGAFDAIPW